MADHDNRRRPWAHHLICQQCDPEGCTIDDWARELLKLPLRWRLAHQPIRPAWSCNSCPDPWPCPAALDDLAVGYADEQVTLLIYLCHMLSQAAAELEGITAAELRTRFLPLFLSAVGTPVGGDQWTRPDLPDIPPGTLLRINNDDWYHPDEATFDVDRNVALIVAKVHTDSATDVSVWITGHAPECTWPTSEYHPPCIELRVLCNDLRRIAGWGTP